MKKLIGFVAASMAIPVLFVPISMMQTFATSTSGSNGGQVSTSCIAKINTPEVNSLDSEQLNNAALILNEVISRSLNSRAGVIAIATALQESSLRNLRTGDRDSVGLFQQRPSSGWGTKEQLLDPKIATNKFLDALIFLPNWETLDLSVAAQSVQRSAFPLAYGKWESLATVLVKSMVTSGGNAKPLSCGDNVSQGLPSSEVGQMLSIALRQRGKPYVWGGIGPDFFDCSGLIVYSWKQVGRPLSIRTSEQMYSNSSRVTPGLEQPGDLLFSHFASAGPGHVMIVLTKGTAIEAPHTGDVVKTVSYTSANVTIGRLDSSAFA